MINIPAVINLETPPPSSTLKGALLDPGALLNGTYRIERLLAEGGMGIVYLATHERLPGRFVVKTLHPSLADDPLAQERLHREAEVLANLNHPNIVKVLDFNRTADGIAYLVMEYLAGSELKEIICTRSLDPWEVARVVSAVSSALAAAHSCGIVHGDLKPENVLIVPVLGQEDVVKLIDFGVSNLCMSTGADVQAVVLGTPNYMSPEQISGSGPMVNERSDQFSLAVMTFEMLAGEQPFADSDDAHVLMRILNDPPARLHGRVSWVPRAVEPVLRRAMEKRPSSRFATVEAFAREFANALQADIGGGMTPVRDFTTAAPQPAPPARDAPPMRTGQSEMTQKLRPLPSHSKRRVGSTQAASMRILRPSACRRPGGRPVLWTVTLALAACVFFCPQERTRALVAGGRVMTGRLAELVIQTIDKGVNKTAAQAGILKPRSSDSGSAHPFPP
jgi:serine/threonine protein kinase